MDCIILYNIYIYIYIYTYIYIYINNIKKHKGTTRMTELKQYLENC